MHSKSLQIMYLLAFAGMLYPSEFLIAIRDGLPAFPMQIQLK